MDLLSNCSCLHQIISYLDRPDILSCFTVSRHLNRLISERRMLIKEVDLVIEVKGEDYPLVFSISMGRGITLSTTDRRAIIVTDNSISTTQDGHTFVIANLTKQGNAYVSNQGDRILMPIQNYAQGLRYALQFVLPMVKLGRILISTSAQLFGLEQTILEAFRDFYGYSSEELHLKLHDTVVQHEYLELAKHLGSSVCLFIKSYIGISHHMDTFPLDRLRVHIYLDEGVWPWSRLLELLQEWERGERDIRSLRITCPVRKHGDRHFDGFWRIAKALDVPVADRMSTLDDTVFSSLGKECDEYFVMSRKSDNCNLDVAFLKNSTFIDIEPTNNCDFRSNANLRTSKII